MPSGYTLALKSPSSLFLSSLHSVLLCFVGLLLLGQYFLNTPSPLPWGSPPGDILFALQKASKGPHLHTAATHHPGLIGPLPPKASAPTDNTFQGPVPEKDLPRTRHGSHAMNSA